MDAPKGDSITGLAKTKPCVLILRCKAHRDERSLDKRRAVGANPITPTILYAVDDVMRNMDSFRESFRCVIQRHRSNFMLND